MLRSMYAGISGMKGFQTKLDVVGNNIANVNTVGFKRGRATFQDMMSQMTSGAQAATGTRGGVNPVQVGLGSQLGSIDNIHTQGFRETTGNILDFSIEGDGMFVVRDGTTEYYTRAGNFYLDDNGFIVNPDGLYLMGYSTILTEGREIISDRSEIVLGENNEAREVVIINEQGNRTSVGIRGTENGVITLENDVEITISGINGDEPEITISGLSEEQIETTGTATNITLTDIDTEGGLTTLNIPDNAESYSVQSDGIINFVDQDGRLHQAGQIVLANFSNPAGLEKAGSNLFRESANSGFTGIREPESEGMGSLVSGALEMSNVDLAEEFTEMITAQRGFQANTRIITTSDEILQELVNLKR